MLVVMYIKNWVHNWTYINKNTFPLPPVNLWKKLRASANQNQQDFLSILEWWPTGLRTCRQSRPHARASIQSEPWCEKHPKLQSPSRPSWNRAFQTPKGWKGYRREGRLPRRGPADARARRSPAQIVWTTQPPVTWSRCQRRRPKTLNAATTRTQSF